MPILNLEPRRSAFLFRYNLLVLFLAIGILFPVSASALEPVTLTDDTTGDLIGTHLEILEDEENSLTEQDVVSPEFDDRFIQSKVDAPAYGYTGYTYWIRFNIHNRTSTQSDWLVELSYAALHETVDAYLLTDADEPVLIARTGLLVPRNERPYSYRYPVIPLKILPGEQKTVYLKVHTSYSSLFPIRVLTPETLADEYNTAQIIIGIYVGILLTMILYNFSIFAMLGDKAYLYYSLLMASSLLAFTGIYGVPQFYLWDPPSRWVINSEAFFISLMNLFGTLFGRKFLNTSRYTPFFDKVLLAFIVFYGFAAVDSVINILPLTTNLIMTNFVAGGVNAPLILVIAFVCYRRGYKPALYFIIAWAILLMSLAVAYPMWLGILPYNFFISIMPGIGEALEAVLLSLALAYRIRTTEYARDRAEALAAARQRLARYFPKPLVEKILSAEEEAIPKSERKNITLIFSDLTGFTDLTDRVEPERLSALLNQYLTSMTEIIEKHGGTLDKIMGDGIMTFFGAPDEMNNKEQAQKAMSTAVEMQLRLKGLAENWRTEGMDNNIELRIGVHQEYVTVGNFGSNERMSYTAIGSGVNFASRLEQACTPGNVLVSYSIYALTKDKFQYDGLMEQEFKGIARKQKVAELDHGNAQQSEPA